METTVAVFFISVFVGLVCWAATVYPQWFKPWVFEWFRDILDTSLDHWGLKKKYEDELYLASRYVILFRVVHRHADITDLKKEVAEIIRQTYITFYGDSGWDEEDVRLASATFIATIRHKEILDLARSVVGLEDVDVKKATLLAIDVLGELTDLSTELGQEYFQHLVYGINKTLIIIRDQGTSQDALKKVSTTLFRVYKLTKAYKHRKGLKNLTREEFYEKVNSSFNTLSSLFGL